MAPILGSKGGKSIISPPVNITASITYCWCSLKGVNRNVSNKTMSLEWVCGRIFICKSVQECVLFERMSCFVVTDAFVCD